jgi:hypothetical protein
MKTLILWNDYETEPVFFLLDGNYSIFDGVYIGAGENEELETDLAELMLTDNGNLRTSHLIGRTFEFGIEFDYMIHCGCVPDEV